MAGNRAYFGRLEWLSSRCQSALYVATMPGWATSLIGAVLGFAAAFVPAQMSIRNVRTTRSQDAAANLLGRMFAVSDAIQYSLNAAKSRQDTGSIEHALWLSGELPEQVGRSLVLLPNDARGHAQDVSDKLRLAGMSLESYSKASNGTFLDQASETYNEAQTALKKFREALST